MDKTLKLVFVTENNKNFTLNIVDPQEPVDASNIKTAMDTIITNDIINTVNGALIGIKGASLVTRTVEEITLP